MSKKLRKPLSWLLALCMILSLLPMSVFAADGITYDKKETAIKETGVTANKTVSDMPDKDGNYTITLSVTGNTTTEPGVKNLPADIVLVVDTSTSMDNEVRGTEHPCGGKLTPVGPAKQLYHCENDWGHVFTASEAKQVSYKCTKEVLHNRLYVAKEASKQFVTGLLGASNQIKMGLCDFSGSKRTGVDLTANQTELLGEIDKLRMPSRGDGTNYAVGLKEAQNILEDSAEGRQKFVVFLSDGKPTEGDGPAIARELQNDGVTIMTVGIDFSNDSALKAISSKDKNGNYYCYRASSDGSSGDTLQVVLALIQEKIEHTIYAGTDAVMTDVINTDDFEFASADNVLTYDNEDTLTWNIGNLGSETQSATFKVKPKEGKYGTLYTNGSVSLTFNSTVKEDEVTFTTGAIDHPSVNIAAPQHTITASAGANGAITPSDAVQVTHGADQAFTITPNNGYAVDTITIDGTNYVNNGTNTAPGTDWTSYTFTGVTQNHTINVTFGEDTNGNQVPDDKEQKYSVTYQWTDAPADTVKLYDVSGKEVTLELPEDNETYLVNTKYAVDDDYAKGYAVFTHNTNGNINGKYTFSGWKLNGTVVTGNQQMPDSNVELTGEWKHDEVEVQKHTVKYDWGTENVPSTVTLPASVKVDNDDTHTVDTTYSNGYTVTADGGTYTFSGWNKSGTITVTDDVTITGSWTFEQAAPKTITFTYVAGENGSLTGAVSETVTVLVDASASPAKVPTPNANKGYEFAGWQIGEGSSAALVTSEQLKDKSFSENTTFTAIFKEKDPETPDAPEKCNLDGIRVEVTCTNDYATHAPKTELYTLADGVYKIGEVMWDSSKNQYACEITVYSSAYVAKYNTESGSKHELDVAYQEPATFTVYYQDGQWGVSGIKVKFTVKCQQTEPQWVTVTFDSGKHGDFGKKTEKEVRIEKDSYLKASQIPDVYSDNGYKFVGWYKNGDKSELYSDADLLEMKFKTNATFTALYKRTGGSGVDVDDDYDVIYNANFTDGGYPRRVGYDEDDKVTVSDNKWFEREGYTFIGWNTKANGNGDSYLPGDTFRMPDSDVYLYAQWQKEKPGPDDTGVSRWLETEDHNAYLTGYPDSTFGADRNMTRAEVAQMFYALLKNKNVMITTSFSDVSNDAWYATAVKTMASLGMMSGYPDGTFRPDEPITRAEFATVALAFAYEPDNARCSYLDVSTSAWYYTYVAQATTYGWIGGYPDGTFRPNNSITRVEVCVIVNNMLGRTPDEDYIDRNEDELVNFVDLSDRYWGYYTIMEATNGHEYTGNYSNETWKDVV